MHLPNVVQNYGTSLTSNSDMTSNRN